VPPVALEVDEASPEPLDVAALLALASPPAPPALKKLDPPAPPVADDEAFPPRLDVAVLFAAAAPPASPASPRL
jgi:hypothetical protein